MADEFPNELKQFIAANIKSVAELELLLLLRGDPLRQWTAAELSRALYTSEPMVAALAASLAGRGLLQAVDPGPRYAHGARTDELARLVAGVCDLYLARRVAVITAIYSEPMDSVQSFADAFKFRKDK